jgi:D-sedoheptulose 7-phosphate isomerase
MNHDSTDYVTNYLAESIAALGAFAADAAAPEALAHTADTTVAAMRAGKKLLIAGNGGSGADAQHIAGEFISRLMFDHAPLPAIALTTDTSALSERTMFPAEAARLPAG